MQRLYKCSSDYFYGFVLYFSPRRSQVTCEGHFSQQVLDLWSDAQFVQIQTEINHIKV